MPISNDAFAKKMMKALRRAGVDDALRYDADRFALVSDKSGEFFLASAHQFYCQAPFWRRRRVIKRYASTMFHRPLLDYPKTFDEARGNLVPVVHTTGYLDVADLLMRTRSSSDGAGGSSMHFQPLAGTLCVGLAYDTPLALGLFPAAQLAKWGVTFDDAMKAARYNLSVRSRDPMAQVAPGLYMAPWQDANAAGRILLTELLTRLPVDGDVIACAPGRDYLFVAGANDAAALGAMVLAVEKALAAPKANTPELFRLRGTEWEPFRLPADHPLATRHASLVAGLISDDYAHQQKLIEELHKKRGADDVVVTKHTAMVRDDGVVYSATPWPRAPALLPRADLIAILDDDHKPTMLVEWDAAAEIVGAKLQRQEQYRLERYLVSEPPTTDELIRLRERRVAK